MGQNSILNVKQKLILNEFKQDDRLSSSFYFTGGTALSEFYLKHRVSIDLDFFSQKTFNSQLVMEIIESWSYKYKFSIRTQFIDPTYNYFLNFSDGQILKLDFARYPYKQLEKERIVDGLRIDSKFDIAVNKLLTTNQRSEVKDYVDLYFLMKTFNFWQLRDGAKIKFNIEIEPFIAATDFMKVDDFEILPMMHKKLSLETLKAFFKTQSKILGLTSIR